MIKTKSKYLSYKIVFHIKLLYCFMFTIYFSKFPIFFSLFIYKKLIYLETKSKAKKRNTLKTSVNNFFPDNSNLKKRNSKKYI